MGGIFDRPGVLTHVLFWRKKKKKKEKIQKLTVESGDAAHVMIMGVHQHKKLPVWLKQPIRARP
jgi:hypothetical protein